MPRQNIEDILKEARNALDKKPKVETELNQGRALQEVRIQLSTKLVIQALRYREILFYFLLVLMTVETLFLFLIVCVTAKPYSILIIPDRTLQIIVGATIIQISAMMIVIIKSIYPKDLKQLIDISKELSEIKQ